MIGIDMAAIKALEKRTADLQSENKTLKQSTATLQAEYSEQLKIIAVRIKHLEALEENR